MGLLRLHFCKIYNRVMGLGYCQNFVYAQYLANLSMEFDQTLYICIYLNHIKVGIVAVPFSQIYNTVMALGYHSELVSAQYFEIELIELNQILHIQRCWQVVDWDCYVPIFADLQHSYGPLLSWGFCFRSISFEWINGILIEFCICIDLNHI